MATNPKRQQTPPEAETQRPVLANDPLVQVVELLGGLIQTFGRYAFDTGTTEASVLSLQCEAWARHILIGTPSPNATEPSASQLEQRDWRGVRDFFCSSRITEYEFVNASMRDMRQSVWTCLDQLNQALAETEAQNQGLLHELDRLREIVEHGKPEEVRRTVLDAAERMGRLLTERAQSQRRRMEELGQQLRTVNADLREARRETMLDPMTMLYNRRAFDEHLAQAVHMCSIGGQPASLFMVDIDHFKAVNDAFGHVVGDNTLRAVADALTRVFPRKSDFVCRFGGEEFAVVAHQTSLSDARMLAGRLLKSVRANQITVNGVKMNATVSIGVGTYVAGEGAEGWLARADAALYEAKRAGRNRMVLAGESPAPPKEERAG